MRLLDLFCGEGGAGVGYARAGFEVFGVDTSSARLERYPFPHHKGDALAYLLEHGHAYDAIHASPPCTGYSRGTVAVPDRLERYDRLIGATREALETVGKPYVIENVNDARPELRDPVRLCGRMFGLTATDTDGVVLTLNRHRLFEVAGFPVLVPEHTPHGWKSDRRDGIRVAGVYSGARRDKHEARHVRKGGYVPADVSVLSTLLGIEWMSETGLQLSIPPVYTQHIGACLAGHLEAVAL